MPRTTLSSSRNDRNPPGVVIERPIALRLMPEELDKATRLAKTIGCSKAALARRAYLAGLPLVAADVAPSKA
jgi:hypothetical protein